ncbi:hypothetical protein P7C70_g4682, partial [Phenoliferia sp. Uapishka_3]
MQVTRMPPLLSLSPLAPLIVPSPSPSPHGRPSTTNVPRPEEWWKWPRPSRFDALEGSNKDWIPRTKRKKLNAPEVKIVGAWRVGEPIGHGSSGKVRLARHTTTGEFAAIKRIPRPSKDSKHWFVLEREIIMMKLGEHPRIIRLLDVFETPTHVLPFDDDSIPEMMRKIKTGIFTIPSSVEENAKDLIRRMVIVKPEHRISIIEVGKHPYLKGVRQPEEDAFSLPYPLASDVEQSRPPSSRQELDAHLLSNLKILLRTSSDQRAVEAILREDGPQLFYVILRNFRTRQKCLKDDFDTSSSGHEADVDDAQDERAKVNRIEERKPRRALILSRPLSSNQRSHSVPAPRTKPPSTPLPRLPTGPSSNPLPARTWPSALQVASTNEYGMESVDGGLLFPSPPGFPFPRRSTDLSDVSHGGSHDGSPEGDGKARKKTFSIRKVKQLFSGGKHARAHEDASTNIPPSPTPSGSSQFAIIRAAPLPLLPQGKAAKQPRTPDTPLTPLPANPRSIKRSTGIASLARAAIGLSPASPSPSSPAALEEGRIMRKKSSLNPVLMVRGSWLDPRSGRTDENSPPPQKEEFSSTSPLSASNLSLEKRRPSPLNLVGSNRVPTVDPRSPLPGSYLEKPATAPLHSISPRPSGAPLTLLSAIESNPTSPFFLPPLPPSPLVSPRRPNSAGTLRGPGPSAVLHHKVSGSVVTKLEAENKLLRAAMEIKDDEIDSLRASKVRLTRDVKRQSALYAQLEGEKDELAEQIGRMSFETNESVERRWLSLMRDTEEGRSSSGHGSHGGSA